MKVLSAILLVLAGRGAWECVTALVHLTEADRLTEDDVSWLVLLAFATLVGGILQWHSKRKTVKDNAECERQTAGGPQVSSRFGGRTK